MRILIAGGPRCGKTTLADQLAGAHGVVARHTDDLIGQLEWSAASAQVAGWLDEPGPWVIEGVAVPRALRKWFAAHPTGKPADRVIWLPDPVVPRTPKQDAMAKGCATVWWEVLPLLGGSGVEVRVGPETALRD